MSSTTEPVAATDAESVVAGATAGARVSTAPVTPAAPVMAAPRSGPA
ncbi:MAG TPA: hypothetical protein VN257_10755 [Actinotalea sp.]|nr:hypothetical protein [Actinotalea sp.]